MGYLTKRDMEEKISSLLTYLNERREYYLRMIQYEDTFQNTKVTDSLDARRQELDYVVRELQRIINSNPPQQ